MIKEEKVMVKQDMFRTRANQVARLVAQKNRAYGNSFAKTSAFLKLCYPNGIETKQYDDMLTIVRIFDKIMRIATAKEALGENPWQDINGYSLLALVQDDLRREG